MALNFDGIQAAVALGAMGGGMMWTAFRRFWRARKVSDTPACPVASMPAGFGEAHGVAWGSESFRDSYGNECAYLEQSVEEYVKRGKSGSWVVRARFASHDGNRNFYALDSSGLAKVFPRGAETNLREVTRDWSKLTSHHVQLVLANVGTNFRTPSASFFSSRWRLREKRIFMANPILIQGNFVPYSTPEILNSAEISYLRRKFGGFLNPLVRRKLPFDFNRDGKVDANEMRIGMSSSLELARRTTANSGADKAVSSDTVSLNNHSVCGEFRAHEAHKLFLADAHEADLLKRIGQWNALLFVAGACAVGAGLYLSFGSKL
jgi:hypothetical protein